VLAVKAVKESGTSEFLEWADPERGSVLWFSRVQTIHGIFTPQRPFPETSFHILGKKLQASGSYHNGSENPITTSEKQDQEQEAQKSKIDCGSQIEDCSFSFIIGSRPSIYESIKVGLMGSLWLPLKISNHFLPKEITVRIEVVGRSKYRLRSKNLDFWDLANGRDSIGSSMT
ncbi:hypothetical protein CEXT_429041, partial [Caerostris extrusa]